MQLTYQRFIDVNYMHTINRFDEENEYEIFCHENDISAIPGNLAGLLLLTATNSTNSWTD